ncbi:hypothetical protein NST62_05935 [Ureibacillus sp. FSL K6-8385]|uniref:Uncharacterized protein n=1 Tax=Ureibacillus terrenus TaxID=118246 RepID=A0A540V638_9BACL|nr:hypothetical protein [Ureibacillus terrenus]MED3660829.1 hypothetical protein [Ureibacillus terrenus]TQE92185.1 hypothetical protein FKZ59_00315 [Ureibacillus terrenus]
MRVFISSHFVIYHHARHLFLTITLNIDDVSNRVWLTATVESIVGTFSGPAFVQIALSIYKRSWFYYAFVYLF